MIVTNNEIGISFHAVVDLTVIGNINPDIPSIINRLKLLLPTMLPSTMSEYPFIEPIIFTTNSGAEVPNETTVKPIAKSEILYFLAKAEAPSTSQFAPKIKQTNPRITNKT